MGGVVPKLDSVQALTGIIICDTLGIFDSTGVWTWWLAMAYLMDLDLAIHVHINGNNTLLLL